MAVDEAIQDIVDIKPLLAAPSPSSFWMVWMILGVGLCVLGIIIIWWWRRKRRSETISPRAVLKGYIQHMDDTGLSDGQWYTAMTNVVRQTAVIAWGVQASGLTAAELASLVELQTPDSALGRDVAAVLVRSEAMRFAPEGKTSAIGADQRAMDRETIHRFATRTALQDRVRHGGKHD
ncbi:DUF4381 family protein [Desulfovibrio inopinatus]|uniref:DUF4381 family protein n=1 Tax=Desulfovibrio inopinatus TaxID=102109 RepID=UPI000407957C|nr:DUF4381 family protein [Desulfovibrio inopinatus]